ncbi:MAG: hypothetical protein J1F42_01460 [Lachnospiraceae bacterium]|nr:hypothetical protein [Lachnospiraceae bacterium]
MASHKEWGDDDGRIIADMSGIERPRFIVPRIRDRKSFAERGSASSQRESGEQNVIERSWEKESEFTPQERRMYVLGALKAALLIALAFIAGLGAAVWLMLLAWT